MAENDVYDWLHTKQAPRVRAMNLGELLLYHLTRKTSGADKLNTGPANFVNIIVGDRFKELGIDRSLLDTMTNDEIISLAHESLRLRNE